MQVATYLLPDIIDNIVFVEIFFLNGIDTIMLYSVLISMWHAVMQAIQIVYVDTASLCNRPISESR